MQISESILVAIFCMAVVFAVLTALWAIIRIFSSVICTVERKYGKKSINSNT